MSRYPRDPARREEDLDEERPKAPAHEAAPIAYEPTRLADARLAQGRNEPLRIAMVRQAQQAYGNRAVGRMLARVPNPELETKPAIKHKTGKEVDAYLDASPFFKKLVADAVKAGKKAEGHVHIWTKAEFLTKCEAYLKGKENPDTSAVFTDAEATAFAKNVNAYQDGGDIHVNEERGEAATTVHESMHLFAEATVKDKVGFNVNEGMTEYFTKKLCAEQTPAIPRGDFYPDQHKSVKKLVGYAGEDVVAAAYFSGKLAELEAAVDKKAGASGAGTYSKWLGYLKLGKYAEADALL
jgi:hypothetical protein